MIMRRFAKLLVFLAMIFFEVHISEYGRSYVRIVRVMWTFDKLFIFGGFWWPIEIKWEVAR